jgi:hypothetical protein
MLPSFQSKQVYEPRKNNRKNQDAYPYKLLSVLLLSSFLVWYTRKASEAAQAALSADGATDLTAAHRTEQRRPQQQQRRRQPNPFQKRPDPRQAAEQDQPFPLSPLQDESAYPHFDKSLHNSYLTLPALPPLTKEELHGGWIFTEDVYSRAANHPGAEVLSWSAPRLVRIRSFLSPAEVNHLVSMSKPHLTRSEVLSSSDSNAVDNSRTSYGYWPKRDSVVAAVEERIHRLVGVPKDFGEGLYVLSYKGAKFQRYW